MFAQVLCDITPDQCFIHRSVYNSFGGLSSCRESCSYPNLRSYILCYNAISVEYVFISRHLLGLKREDEARAALSELNGVPGDDPLIQDIIEELQLGIKEENEGGKATWWECFSTRNLLWKRTGNGMMYVHSGLHNVIAY